MKVAIYTANYGQYDNVHPPVQQSIDCQWHIFGAPSPGWNKMDNKFRHLGSPVLNARAVKILSHLLFSDHDYVIWVDGSIAVTGPEFAQWAIRQLDQWEGRRWGVFRHRTRTDIDQEANECKSLGYMVNQNSMDRYYDDGFDGSPLYETGIMVRQPRSESVRQIEMRWFTELMIGSPRDQLSLPYCFWKEDFTPAIMPGFVTQGPCHKYIGHRTHVA